MTPSWLTSGRPREAPARVVCFGEVLARLSTRHSALLKSSTALDLHIGGAEANVAATLAGLGHDVALVSALPRNGLGELAMVHLRGHGVDCARIRRTPGRLGLYFTEAGASLRASQVIYDRAGSSFAVADWTDVDWTQVLAGADLFHVSGISVAIGEHATAAVNVAMTAARQLAIPIAFDGNFRPQLWEGQVRHPRDALLPVMAQCDLFFGGYRDIALLLDRPFDRDDTDRDRTAAEAAFATFSELQLIASTTRVIESVSCHRLSARVDGRDDIYLTEQQYVAGIVDRIGTGDAFAAGVIHGLFYSGSLQFAAETGLMLACLKHSTPGDAAAFDEAHLATLRAGELDVRR